MDILVTGGNGLLGRHLIPQLQERGDAVRVLVLPGEDATWLEQRGVRVFRGDVRDKLTLFPTVNHADAVLNLAGMMGVWRPMADYRAVNVTGTENVCHAALAAGVKRLVHISSWTVYGMDLGMAVSENAALAPFREPYAVTKTEGDQVVQRMVREDGLPAVILRPGTFFGPGDQLHFGRMADRVRSGKGVVVGSGRNALPFVYVTDVVQGILLGLDSEGASGSVYNITNDAPITQGEMLQAIAEELGAAPPRVHIPYPLLYTAGYAAERAAQVTRAKRQPVVTRLGVKLFGTDNRHSIERARRELGFAPRVALRDGVRLAAAWYRQKNAAGRVVESAHPHAGATDRPTEERT